MRILFSSLLFIFASVSGYSQKKASQSVPEFAKGKFVDDYGITYQISDSLWKQQPNVVYRIIKWNPEKQYIIAQNGANNPSDRDLYTRIDYMTFNNMDPFNWGFCLTQYKASSIAEAEATAAADRENPRKGCNGYPFSRMKRAK